jgi:hypothetical protein
VQFVDALLAGFESTAHHDRRFAALETNPARLARVGRLRRDEADQKQQQPKRDG